MAKVEDTASFTITLSAAERLVVQNALSVQATVYRRRVNAEVNPHIKELVKVSLNDVVALQSRF